MTVYILAQLSIHDRETYDKYESSFPEVFEKFDGEVLSVDEAPIVVSGSFEATRSVLMKFPTRDAAFKWMLSPEYKAISKFREAASTSNTIVVKAFEGWPEK